MAVTSAGDVIEPDSSSGWILKILRAAMALPGARVDRASFMNSQLRAHYSDEEVTKAIEFSPAFAGMSLGQIDKIADSVIKSHVVKAAGLSFAAGVPGGLLMAATIPADTIQFVWHAIVIAQKLAYLYGWPDLLEDGEPDEETLLRMVLLIGAMLGVAEATRLLTEIANRFAQQVGRRLPRYALTKTAYYPLIKTILKWVGIRLTKQSFARGISKVIPFVSGVISAGVTAFTLRPMARKLKAHLRELEYARAT